MSIVKIQGDQDPPCPFSTLIRSPTRELHRNRRPTQQKTAASDCDQCAPSSAADQPPGVFTETSLWPSRN